MNSKSVIRQLMLQRRNSLSGQLISDLSMKVCQNILELSEIKRSSSLCIFLSKPNEVQTKKIIESLNEKEIFVPVTADKINLVKFSSFDDLHPGSFGVPEPRTKVYADVSPDLFIVPGLAFDYLGNRLGYGKGFYDKLLKELTSIKIGVCFDFQLVEQIPQNDYDIKMDIIVTDKKVLRCPI